MPVVRPMVTGDTAGIFALQARCYPPELHDSEEAFRARLVHAPGMHFVAQDSQGELLGYIVAHPWQKLAPPPVDMVMAEPPIREVCYVHDLSVSPDCAGQGIGQRLFEAMRDAALENGLERSELTAVRGAHSFWARHGYSPVYCDTELAAKVSGYGADAVYMARNL